MSVPSGYLRHIDFCTRYDPAAFLPFRVAGLEVGWVTREVAAHLAQEVAGFVAQGEGLALADTLADYAARSEALRRATDFLCKIYGMKLRGELYPVVRDWGDAPLAELDRIAVPWFGVRGFGVHVNGFVRRNDGIHMWIAERAADRLVDPGLLDNMIGGGLPLGLTVEENLVKEAWEEAAVERVLARTARPAGHLNYKVAKMRGLRNDTLFVFDLELPPDFVPRNTDGEVAAFRLLPLAEVAALVRDTDRFKFNCNVVIVDFMLRQGFLANDPELAALREALAGMRG